MSGSLYGMALNIQLREPLLSLLAILPLPMHHSNGYGNHAACQNRSLSSGCSIQNRLNTREMLTKKNFYIEDESCVLCEQGENENLM